MGVNSRQWTLGSESSSGTVCAWPRHRIVGWERADATRFFVCQPSQVRRVSCCVRSAYHTATHSPATTFRTLYSVDTQCPRRASLSPRFIPTPPAVYSRPSSPSPVASMGTIPAGTARAPFHCQPCPPAIAGSPRSGSSAVAHRFCRCLLHQFRSSSVNCQEAPPDAPNTASDKLSARQSMMIAGRFVADQPSGIPFRCRRS